MKKFIKPMAAIALLGAGTAMASDGDVDARLQEMERMIQQQQRQITELKAAMSGQEFLTREEASSLIQNEVDAIVETRVESGLAQLKDTAPILTLGNNINGLDIRGDLRLRWEYKEEDGPAWENTRDRFRVRLRVGGVWKSEGWKVALGLATGGEDARSTNDTYSENTIFETGNINLDYAYVEHSWGDLTVSAGQRKNPFETTWMIWDGDVRPIGLFVEWEHQDFFVNAGGMYTNEDSGEADGYAFYGQAGYNGSVGPGKFTVATGLMYVVPSTFDNDGEDLNFGDGDYDFLIWDVLGKYSYKMDNGVKLGVHGHFAMNFGAEDGVSQLSDIDFTPGGYDADDENMAFLVGASIGYKAWSLKYEYAHIEGDAVYGPLTDSDFGDTTDAASVDVRGHKLGAKYKHSDNLSFGVTAMFTEPIERNDGDVDGTHVQVDAVYKF